MIQSYKDYVIKEDFYDYVKVSSNINDPKFSKKDDTDLSIYIQESMIQDLEYILSSKLYDSVMTLYSKSSNVLSITVGTETIIEVSDASFIDTDYVLQVSSVVGTLSTINDTDLTVLNVTGNLITVDYDSTGLVYDSGGVVQNISSSLFHGLRSFIKPYLIYNSYSRYVASSNTHTTPYGVVAKNNQFSTPSAPSTLGQFLKQNQRSVEFWRDKLVEELETGKYNAEGYQSNNIAIKSDNSILPIYSKKRRLLGTLQSRRWT